VGKGRGFPLAALVFVPRRRGTRGGPLLSKRDLAAHL